MDKSTRTRSAALTPQQAAFAETVARGVPLADAYRAHFKVRPGTKAKSIHEAGSKLANHPKVAPRIRDLRARIQAVAEREFDVDVKRWLRQTCRIAFADVRRYYRSDGTAKLPHELDDDAAAAVIGVVRDSRGNVVDYRIERRPTALDMIARHLGAFDADNRQAGDNGMKELMAFIAERGKLEPVRDVEFKERVVVQRPSGRQAGELMPVEREHECAPLSDAPR